MRRRTFLAGLGFAALQLAGCAAKLQTTPDYVLTYADNQPAGYPTTQGAQYFADLVQQQTGGKVVIQVKANGEYGTEQQVWEQLAIGGVDFARVSLSVATNDLPRLNVLLLPYLYRDADHMWRVLDGSIGAEFLQDFTAQGRVGLSWYDAGARPFYARRVARLSRKWLPVLPKGRTIPGKKALKYRFGHLFCRFLPILQCFLPKRLYK